MRSDLLSEILNLSVAERIQLVADVWDSIAAEREELPLTDEEQREVDGRLADAESSPAVGRSWAEVKGRLIGPS